ncbi:hypothetical protein [Giesbergeria anulus]|uniref:hypothetical protein n=1 Tax=Giesbergeria anulus TaxID=180197 RepID=UPI001C43032F|nr:hypothetical protein [Giesbergeria anulus]
MSAIEALGRTRHLGRHGGVNVHAKALGKPAYGAAVWRVYPDCSLGCIDLDCFADE